MWINTLCGDRSKKRAQAKPNCIDEDFFHSPGGSLLSFLGKKKEQKMKKASASAKKEPQFAFMGKTTEIPEGIASSTLPTGTSSEEPQQEGSQQPRDDGAGWSQEDVDISRWTTQHVEAWLEVVQASEDTCQQFEQKKITGRDLLEFTLETLTGKLGLSVAEGQLILSERQLLISLTPAIPTSISDPKTQQSRGAGGAGTGVVFDLNDMTRMHSNQGLKELQANLNRQQQPGFQQKQQEATASNQRSQAAAAAGAGGGGMMEVAAMGGEEELLLMPEVGADDGATTPGAAAPTAADTDESADVEITEQQKRQHEATKQQLNDFFNAVQMQIEGTTAEGGEGSSDDEGEDEVEYKQVVQAIAREQQEREEKAKKENKDEFDF